MTALLLAAVGGARREAGVALAADHLVAVELGSQGLEGRLNDTTTETEDQVEGGLLLDVVVGESAAILELLAGEDQALLVWGNAYKDQSKVSVCKYTTVLRSPTLWSCSCPFLD